MHGVAETLELGVEVANAVPVTLALGVVVPWQIHWPLLGAPQETRQHRFVQDVGETLAEEDEVQLLVAVGELGTPSDAGLTLRELLVLEVAVRVSEVLGEREGELLALTLADGVMPALCVALDEAPPLPLGDGDNVDGAVPLWLGVNVTRAVTETLALGVGVPLLQTQPPSPL